MTLAAPTRSFQMPPYPSSSSPNSGNHHDSSYIQQARARLRPVSHAPGMSSTTTTASSAASAYSANSDSSSAFSLETTTSGNSTETVTADSSSQHRPQIKRAHTTPVAYLDPNHGANGARIHRQESVEEEDEEDDDGEGGGHDGDESGQVSSVDGDEDEDDEDVPVSEEHVVALHDFTSSNATCLSFRAGQIIKVFNRDSSGWWDGELDGQRGWFPSNYVDEEGMAIGSPEPAHNELTPEDPMMTPHMRRVNGGVDVGTSGQYEAVYGIGSSSSGVGVGAGAVGTYRRSATSMGRRSNLSSYGESSSSSSSRRSTSILEPIQHSIALLQNAVRASRWPHFQPATACVISSVRSVLSATDCLTRESATLRAHPVLAKERKQVLSELSRLVTQSRRASAVAVDAKPNPSEMQDMLRYAHNVLNNTRRFLAIAVECGATLPDQRSSLYDALHDNDLPDRSELDRTPTPGSPRSSYLTAHTSDAEGGGSGSLGSFGDILHAGGSAGHHHLYRRGDREPHSAPVTRMRGGSAVAAAHRRPLAARQRTDSDVSGAESVASSSGTGSRAGSSGGESASDDHNPGPVVQSRDEALDRLKRAHDHLLSIVAAFVGHIHTHTRDSHASSYAFLIDVTREAVDGVRNLLIVVEGVNDSETLQSQFPTEMSLLRESRDSLYEATTALVTAARMVTSHSVASPDASPDPGADDEKSKLLAAATALLRTGQECVSAVRMCLGKAEPTFVLTLTTPTKAEVARDARAEARRLQAEQEEEEERAVQEAIASGEVVPTTLRRHKHTLSFLGRKATSLSCLKQKYESDADLLHQSDFAPVSEDELGPEDEAASSASGGLEASSASHAATAHHTRAGPLPPSFHKTPIALRRGVTQPASLMSESLDEDGTPRSGPPSSAAAVGGAEAGGGSETSDSSEAMSRQDSRTSGSTLNSLQSTHTDYTDDTSARPSMDRSISTPGPGSSYDHVVDPRKSMAPSVAGTVVSAYTASTHHRASQMSSVSASATAAAKGGKSATAQPFLEARFMAPSYDPTDICYNSEGQVTGATLPALVEKMTPHDTTVEATFSNAFFLCFRLFTSPMELFEALVARYNLPTPPEIEQSPEALQRWMNNKVMPVRLRVLNFFKIWLELHWQPSADRAILEPLVEFIKVSMTHSLARSGQRLAELAQKRLSSNDGRTTVLQAGSRGPGSLKRIVSAEQPPPASGGAGGGPLQGLIDVNSMYLSSAFLKGVTPTPPASLVSKSLLATLRSAASNDSVSVNILDFDALELARQLTIMESKVFCCILPEELLGQEFSKKSGQSSAVHVKKMSALTTHITGWIAECILGEADTKKRTQLVKYFIKLGDRCLAVNNFNALFAIQSALNASTITRLRKTWDGVPSKYTNMMEAQRNVIEHTRNFAVYRARLRATFPPALPFVGLFLTDLTFCHEGNAATRPSPLARSKQLLNFDKYVKLSRIVQELQRFQVPFNFVEVPEIQHFFNKNVLGSGAKTSGPEELYKRSLFLEPRAEKSGGGGGGGGDGVNGGGGGGTIGRGGGGEGGRSGGMDIFNWK